MRITTLALALAAMILLAAPAQADPPIWMNSLFLENMFKDYFEEPVYIPSEVAFVYEPEPSDSLSAEPLLTPRPNLLEEMARRFVKKAEDDKLSLVAAKFSAEKQNFRSPEGDKYLAREKEIDANAAMATALEQALPAIRETRNTHPFSLFNMSE